jgi:hypothetical protein
VIKTRLGLFALAALVVSLSVAAAARQTPAPVPSGLVLQVVYFEGAPPAFHLVSRGPEMLGGWFGRFKTVPRPPAKDALPVRAVDIVSRVEGEGVQIRVSVLAGERHFDRKEMVGTYTAGVGEQVVVKELERFGVEPFRLTVLRLSPNPAAPPVVVNKTQSVEASITAFDSSKGVSARLTLRNLSAKRVLAVEYRETREGRVIWTRFAAEEDGRPLLEPGGVHTSGLSQVHRGEVTPEGLYVPHAPETILVATAVFEDGTYEGEPAAAARAAARNEGARLQLTRALALLRKMSAKSGDAARLKTQVTALDSAADASAVASILKRYAGLGESERELAKSAAEVSMHRIRKELLDELAALEKEPADTGKLGEWLAAKREKFEGWLSRLPPAKAASPN